ncbi:response regulator [Paenibacillus arenilitoris]|uniref:Response regulator n=1 Tax=Paenibacillus arenilitoris TaxID=2772299 RepID=A0A927CHZ1_9BACL|nr:response regulator [Paenibacillus arenilitoris]MBD2868439.1 response regulator [Paenibacillus arenilitoris]
MRFMLVDDERLALLQLEKLLREVVDTAEVEAFQDPEEALAHAAKARPDVVFLDIHMPGLSGLQAAELLQVSCPDAAIVFVTAYDEYAIQAFEVNAVDYVLKPIQKQRVHKTVERLLKLKPERVDNGPADQTPKTIYCLKTLRFQSRGKSPEVPKWRTAKAQEMFAYLLHHKGQIVHKSTLLDLFFPRMDLKRAMAQLYTAIYQIRQCLHAAGMVVSIQNSSIQEGYILEIGEALLDKEQWEQRGARLGMEVVANPNERFEWLMSYEGDYLEDHGYVWAEHESERLRRLWLSHARELGLYYLKADRGHASTVQLYERIQQIDPYSEEEALILLRLYDEKGQFDKVAAYYEELNEKMESELGLSIPVQIGLWYRQWLEERAGKIASRG